MHANKLYVNLYTLTEYTLFEIAVRHADVATRLAKSEEELVKLVNKCKDGESPDWADDLKPKTTKVVCTQEIDELDTKVKF